MYDYLCQELLQLQVSFPLQYNWMLNVQRDKCFSKAILLIVFSEIINVYLALEHVWLQQLDVLYL